MKTIGGNINNASLKAEALRLTSISNGTRLVNLANSITLSTRIKQVPDKSKGLHTDFSDGAVRDRVLQRTAGLAPHERPGHHAPDQQTDRQRAAPRGYEALHRPNLDDGIPHT